MEHRLLKYAKRYEERRNKLKESYYQEILKDRPQVSRVQSTENRLGVFQRLYSAKGGCQSEIEKIVKKSQLRTPLNELIKSNQSQSTINANQTLRQSTEKLKDSMVQGRKYLGSTYSQLQKIKPVR